MGHRLNRHEVVEFGARQIQPAHHVAITRDEKLAFVQNSLLNPPGMSGVQETRQRRSDLSTDALAIKKAGQDARLFGCDAGDFYQRR